MSEPEDSLRYRDAGVNIDAADEALSQAKAAIRRTFTPGVLMDVGAFGGLFEVPSGMREPVLVSSIDGVGTKLKVAAMADRHDTVGHDLVNHCVNDILVQGAQPLFFMDYIGCGVLESNVVATVIEGVANACEAVGCALLGGETAEMPGMYAEGDYDLVGTIVGVVEKAGIVDGARIAPGDVLLGLWSDGLHTNGYSLARRIVFEKAKLNLTDTLPGVGRTVEDALLAPHRPYLKHVMHAIEKVDVKGMAHITGGGLTGNLPRILPSNCEAVIDLTAWAVPPLFSFFKEMGPVEDLEMLRTFNMGMGFVVVVSEADAVRAADALRDTGEDPCVIGVVAEGERAVRYQGTPRYA